MSVLTLTDIAKRFGNHVALNDISLRVDSGEFICLLGGSGCGKTTLLRIIAGLEKHDHGLIQLGETNLCGVPCHKRNIGMVFQSLALFPHLNVGQNIVYGMRMQGAAPAKMDRRADELLDTVGLTDFKSRSVASLSGGQRQRVAIARALALEPQLFLMDEPFSALDAGLREHLQHEVRSLQQSLGVTTIFVTHDQREAMALADRIVVLNDGIIEQTGTPAEIYQQPRSRFVAEFIGSNNLLDVVVSSESVRYKQSDLGRPRGAVQNLQGAHTLAIRPESIQLHTLDQPALLHGTVRLQRTVGALVEHEVDVNGQTIKQTSFQNNSDIFSPGDTVGLKLDWSQVWVLPN